MSIARSFALTQPQGPHPRAPTFPTVPVSNRRCLICKEMGHFEVGCSKASAEEMDKISKLLSEEVSLDKAAPYAMLLEEYERTTSRLAEVDRLMGLNKLPPASGQVTRRRRPPVVFDEVRADRRSHPSAEQIPPLLIPTILTPTYPHPHTPTPPHPHTPTPPRPHPPQKKLDVKYAPTLSSLIQPLLNLTHDSPYLTYHYQTCSNPCSRPAENLTFPVLPNPRPPPDTDKCHACNTVNDFITLIYCDGKNCNKAYHTSCLNMQDSEIPVDDWFCSLCTPLYASKRSPIAVSQNRPNALNNPPLLCKVIPDSPTEPEVVLGLKPKMSARKVVPLFDSPSVICMKCDGHFPSKELRELFPFPLPWGAVYDSYHCPNCVR